jgi:anaerobic magnesium-protoporphyrin IX monomethyl ester cyclase
VGAESGAQKILDAMEKGTRIEQIYRATHQLRDAGIQVGFFLQFGYPGETRQDIERTLQMVRDCQPDDIGMSVSYPLPGTKFHARVKDELSEQQNWQDSSDLAMLYHGPYTTEFYRQLHTVLHKEFRARKYRSELQRLAQRPQDFGRQHFRHIVAMVYHTITLPLERRRLDRLEAQSHTGLGPLPPELDSQAAATPSPQGD